MKAIISFINQKFSEDLAVIWLDAHGDLNTPNSSPSSHFHGMPLRLLLGEGDEKLSENLFSRLYPNQVFLVGARDFDVPETDFIAQNNLPLFTAKEINLGSQKLVSALKMAGFRKLYIHLDLDVIEPKDFPHVACLTPNGIYLDALKKLLVELNEKFDCVGFSVLEFMPHNSQAIEDIQKIVKLINDLDVR